MNLKKALGQALRYVRDQRGLTQEDFSMVSSRTYLSTLERGIKSPTLEKIELIAGKLDVHLVSLMVLAYLQDKKSGSVEEFMSQIADEVEKLSGD